MRFAAVLTVLLALVALSSAITLSKAHPAHASGKQAVKKAHKEAKSKAKETKKAAPEHSHSQSHKKDTAKKSHKKNSLSLKHTSQLVQAKAHEEEFGTTGGGGEESQQTAPPAAPALALRSSSPGGKSAADVWSGELNMYGPCLRDFPSLVDTNECVQDKLGDVEYFLKMVDQEEHTLSAGYKTGMARKAMVIEGIGMNASSSEATPLTRHAFQRSRVELAYACAPTGSECKSYMTLVGQIDALIGKDKQCPTKLMQGSDNPHIKAMRGRMLEITQAYSTNPDAYFWGDSREYAAAVAVCFYIRTYGKFGSHTAPPGMLLKENIYDPAPEGVVVDLEEEMGKGLMNMVGGLFGAPPAAGYSLHVPAVAITPELVEFVQSQKSKLKLLHGHPTLNLNWQVSDVDNQILTASIYHVDYERAVALSSCMPEDNIDCQAMLSVSQVGLIVYKDPTTPGASSDASPSQVQAGLRSAAAFTFSWGATAAAVAHNFEVKVDEWAGLIDGAFQAKEDNAVHMDAYQSAWGLEGCKKFVKAAVALVAIIFDEFKKDALKDGIANSFVPEGLKHAGKTIAAQEMEDALNKAAAEHATNTAQDMLLGMIHGLEALNLVAPQHTPAHHAIAAFLGGVVGNLMFNIQRWINGEAANLKNFGEASIQTGKGFLCGISGGIHLAITGSTSLLRAINMWHKAGPACPFLASSGVGDVHPLCKTTVQGTATSVEWGKCLAMCQFYDHPDGVGFWSVENAKFRLQMDFMKIDHLYCEFMAMVNKPCEHTSSQAAYSAVDEDGMLFGLSLSKGPIYNSNGDVASSDNQWSDQFWAYLYKAKDHLKKLSVFN